MGKRVLVEDCVTSGGDEDGQPLSHTKTRAVKVQKREETAISYEDQIQENIRKNREVMEKMVGDLGQLSSTLFPKKEDDEKAKRLKRRGMAAQKKKKKKTEVLPPRASLRLRQLAPDGVTPAIVAAKEEAMRDAAESKRVRVEGPITFKEASPHVWPAVPNGMNEGSENDEESDAEFHAVEQQMQEHILSIMKGQKAGKGGGKKNAAPAAAQVSDGGMARIPTKFVAPEWGVAKVVPERIMSVAFHPTAEQILFAVGDKAGNLGLFNAGSPKRDPAEAITEDSPQAVVTRFTPHKRPLSTIRFSDAHPAKMFTSSYDGCIRCMDLEKEVFHEMFVHEAETCIQMLDFHSSNPTFFVACDSTGDMITFDSRMATSGGNATATSVQTYTVHDRKVSSIQICPTRAQEVITSSLDQTVKVWDLRKISKKNPSPLYSLPHGTRAVQSAFFSPGGGRVVTQGWDDLLRVWSDVQDYKTHSSPLKVKHDNNTGRWVTNFRTVWHPRYDDVFLVGSMGRPRGCELFDIKGKLRRYSHDNVTAIPALNVFHPTLDCVGSGNASGRVNIWIGA